VDVISVGALAFKRFLEIAALMDLRVDVVTDNDGDLDALKKKYVGYLDKDRIKIRYDDNVEAPALESQLLKINGRQNTNAILGKNYATDPELLAYMKGNKTEVALRFFESDKPWSTPSYIEAAIA